MVGGFEIEPGIVLFSTRREMLRFGAGLATYPNKVEALKSRGECVFMRKGGGIQTLLISKQSQRKSQRQTDRERCKIPISHIGSVAQHSRILPKRCTHVHTQRVERDICADPWWLCVGIATVCGYVRELHLFLWP